MDVTGGQGVQAGDGNVQINLFTGEQPRRPVVAGNVPQAPPAFQPREDLMAALRAAGPGVDLEVIGGEVRNRLEADGDR